MWTRARAIARVSGHGLDFCARLKGVTKWLIFVTGESGSDEFDKDDKRTGFSYQSNFDFDYYNKLLQMEESREELGKNRTGASNFSSQEIVRDDIEEAAADIINEKALAHDMDKTAEECDLKANMNEQTKILRNSMNSGSSEKSEIQRKRSRN